MSPLRRRKRAETEWDETSVETDADETTYDDDLGGGDDASEEAEATGPYDVGDVADPADGRLDMGGMWIPGAEGLEVRVDADPESGDVVAVTLVLEDGALQIAPFAAPRTEGIWDDVRREIGAGITADGGTADEVEGPLGTELRTQVQVRGADGRSERAPARFVGVDGPRWFLRGVLTGRPAVEPGSGEALIALFRDVVVVRGSEPMAPREPIALRLPREDEGPAADSSGAGAVVVGTTEDTEAGGAGGSPYADPLDPFDRGPEITEIR